MFDLEKAIAAWRQVMANRSRISADDLDELERHVRDQTADYVRKGAAPNDAFERALREIGEHDAVDGEYAKVYWGKVVRRRSFGDEFRRIGAMLRHHARVSIRNLRRHKGYAASNLVGLAVGIACCLLIALYIASETGYDTFHEGSDRIYRLAMTSDDASWGTAYDGMAMTPGPWGPAALETLPEVENMVRFRFVADALFRRGEVAAYERNGFYADPSVFEVFTFPFIEGDPATALQRPNTVVLPETTARRYFGEEPAVGQTLLVNDAEWLVTGVMEDIPENTHSAFDFLVSMATYPAQDLADWRRIQMYTYLVLGPEARPEQLARTFTASLDAYTPEQVRSSYTAMLQPIEDIHLHSRLFRETDVGGSIEVVRGLTLIAVFILLIACINYMNLATARSARRAKEIGIRKMSGAHRGMLVRQFVGEATLLSAAATVFGTGLAALFLPAFNRLAGKSIGVAALADPWIVLGLVAGALLVGLLAGTYPAFVLSGFRPIQVLNHDPSGRRRAFLRKGLVVFQFAISGFLIMCTGIVYDQLRFIQTKDLGFDKEQVIVVPMNDDAMKRDVDRLRSLIAQHPGVRGVSASGNLPAGGDWGIPYVPEGIAEEDVPDMRVLVVDHDYVETFGMTIARGRGFSREQATDSLAFLINETAAARLDWSNAIGKQIAMPAIGRPAGPVIGIVEDFHFRSLHEPIEPIMFIIQPPGWLGLISVKIQGGEAQPVIRHLEEVWAEVAPGVPFSYSFFDERFGQMYASDLQVGRLLAYFAVLAILISCLGLLGLAAFTAERRTKEIGIRKVLGASVGGIVTLLSRDVLKLVGLALLVALPLSYLAARQWLQDFAYHVELTPAVFLGGAVMLVGIALVTVGYQCLRAALANPVNSLRFD